MAAERSAAPGDLVTVRLTSDNEAVAASVASEEPLMFQLGSEGIMGNELFQVPAPSSEQDTLLLHCICGGSAVTVILHRWRSH